MTKQIVCTDEKCTIESMPKLSQKGRGRGTGLNTQGNSYLLPLKSSSTLMSKVRKRQSTNQRGRGLSKAKTTSQVGKGRRRRRQTVSRVSTVRRRGRVQQTGAGRKKRRITKSTTKRRCVKRGRKSTKK